MIIGYLPWNQPVATVDQVCMRDDRVELTYADVATRVDAVAEQFAAMGVGRGDVVAVMLPNRVELLLGLMAAWRLGAGWRSRSAPAGRRQRRPDHAGPPPAARCAQAGLRREPVVRAQAEQLHARRRALHVPANHDCPPHRREEGRNPP